MQVSLYLLKAIAPNGPALSCGTENLQHAPNETSS